MSDRPIINTEIALRRLNGSRELLKALAGFFLEDAPRLEVQLQEGLRTQQFPQVIRCAHSLRGLAASFEALPVMEVAGEIERLAQTSETSRLPSLAADLKSELIRLIAVLQKIAESGVESE